MNATRKRLENAEAAVGAGGEQSLSLEFYELSPEGEEIRCTEPHLMAYARPGAETVHKIVFVP